MVQLEQTSEARLMKWIALQRANPRPKSKAKVSAQVGSTEDDTDDAMAVDQDEKKNEDSAPADKRDAKQKRQENE